MSLPVIRVENLGKIYRLGQKEERPRTLIESAVHAVATPLRNFRRLRSLTHFDDAAGAKDVFWALKDVTFDVAQGEVLGIIGRNGAGKSTLLKILSRIMPPTRGRVEIRGRLASLLEVGTGFHPDLSGRDNIFLNGAILGMTRREILQKFDEIVAFADVEKFLDTPVKRYSSGMYVRLAFAVAAHMEPEILIVDEVLSVGDAAFQKKCLGKMKKVSSQEGRTVLFVSHSMQAIATLCTNALVLNNGQVSGYGPAQEMAAKYLQMLDTMPGEILWRGEAGDDSFRLKLARIVRPPNCIFTTDQPLRIELIAEVLNPIYGLVLAIEIHSGQRGLLAYTAHDDAAPPPPQLIPCGPYAWELTIPCDTFAAGAYEFRLDIGIHHGKRLVNENISFLVTLENIQGIGRRYQTTAWSNCFRPAWIWRRLDENELANLA